MATNEPDAILIQLKCVSRRSAFAIRAATVRTKVRHRLGEWVCVLVCKVGYKLNVKHTANKKNSVCTCLKQRFLQRQQQAARATGLHQVQANQPTSQSAQRNNTL